jgi:hypothetical protein
VRTERDRKKKLIVAFHFQMACEERAGRTGWDCDNCRKNGLEVSRRCGFIEPERRGESRVVWARRGVGVDECPKSCITAESLTLLEEFVVRRRLGVIETADTEARKVDAFLILRDQVEREERYGTEQD